MGHSSSMSNYLPAIVISFIILLLPLAGCQESMKETAGNVIKSETTTDTIQNDDKIALSALPVDSSAYPAKNELLTIEPVKELEKELLERGWKELKYVDSDYAGNQKLIVRFFGNSAENNREINAFLEYDGKSMGLGVISNYGIDQADAKMVDMNRDGVNELVVTGVIGATASVTKIIGYDTKRNLWEEWLETGYAFWTDMDNDGEMEIITTSQGSLPPYTWIYRWNGKEYERLDAHRVLDCGRKNRSGEGE